MNRSGKRFLVGLAALCVWAASVSFGHAQGVLFTNMNIWGVGNCGGSAGACAPTFTLASPALISDVQTYHWNNGQGDSGGTISLVSTASGQTLGRANVVVSGATAGVPANFVATFNLAVPAGTYRIVDDRAATWSVNQQSNGLGFATVRGTPISAALFGPAPAPSNCVRRNGFQFLCYGTVVAVSPASPVLGAPMTLTVNPSSGYSFDASTTIILEPSAGVGLGVGLRVLCGGLAAPSCAPFITGPKSLTIPVPSSPVLPAGSYLLRTENWYPAVVVAGVGICNPTCTAADAGFVSFNPPGTPAAGALQITNVSYDRASQLIAVDYVDPSDTVNRIDVRPWLGYQYGNPVSWNPRVTGGLTSAYVLISVGCRQGRSYMILIDLFNAIGQTARRQFSYVC
jgi:hypothetical protein